MPSSTGKRPARAVHNRSAVPTKKARVPKSSSTADEDESTTTLLIHHIDYAKPKNVSVPSIPLDPDLDTLLYPLKRDEFLKSCLRKRAVHITCRSGQEDIHATSRVETIRQEMFDLDPESILRETSSDSVFIWLRKKAVLGNTLTTTSSTAAGDLIQSIEVGDVEAAIALHKIGGHATYCRAPPKVEQNLVSSLLRSTGLGCGQYDPSGDSMASWGRGEVETFISTPDHTTNWHFDFQENFTIQLSGIKRWTIQQGTIQDPIRGCTPHYAAPEAVESQLKAAHLLDRKFRFGYPTTGVNAVGEVRSIDIRPGDTFYFPAGMWHKVETIEPGVSINVSLMAANYATVVSQAIQHILHKIPQWRRPLLHNGINNAPADLSSLLQSLPAELAKTLNAHCIIPPVLRHAPNFQSNDDDDDDDDDDDEVDEMSNTGNAEESDDVEDDQASSDDDDVEKNDEGSDSGVSVPAMADDDEVIDPREFMAYPDDWESRLTTTGNIKVKLRRNPFAVLYRMDEITSFYRNGPRVPDTVDTTTACNVFVLNVNYAGNEMHQSAVRIVFCDSPTGIVESVFSVLESSSSSKPSESEVVEVEPSQDDIPFLKFLLYHGYVILVVDSTK